MSLLYFQVRRTAELFPFEAALCVMKRFADQQRPLAPGNVQHCWCCDLGWAVRLTASEMIH